MISNKCKFIPKRTIRKRIDAEKGSGKLELRQICLIILCLIAAVTDLRYGKVNNELIITGILSGFFFFLSDAGIQGLTCAAAGLCIPLLLLVFYRFGMLGAGDIKLFMMIGTFTGPKEIFSVMAASIAAGAVILLWQSVSRRGRHDIRFALPVFCGVLWEICRTR
ncbi:MAG: A24 family peptidase [Lachnospiraceae bacterium]|nr:A24 family peptidase [Lachnospiraceae bacterium]